MIEIDGTVGGRCGGKRYATHITARIVVGSNNEVAARLADKESVEVEGNPASTAKGTGIDERETVDRYVVVDTGE